MAYRQLLRASSSARSLSSELRVTQQRIKELERALGKKAMEIEILQAARDEVKKRPRYYGVSKR